MEDYYPSIRGVEEVPYDFVQGGVHAVYCGDVYNNRYRALRKLGDRLHSTVWLVEDLVLNRFASLKILAAEISSVSQELHVSRYLRSQQAQNIQHPGHKHVVQIFDTFIHDGPNGTHHCIVSELLGISFDDEDPAFYNHRGYSYPEDVTRKVATQVALAVSYLHQIGVIHGDLSLGNVMLYSDKLQNMSRQDLDLYFGPASPPSLSELLFAPYDTLPLTELCLSSVDDIHVKLCDFSMASLIGSHSWPYLDRQSLILASPEALFNDIASLTPSTDVWALGVLLYMIVNRQRPPFHTYTGVATEVIENMVISLGKLPDKWWKERTNRAEYFDEGVHAYEPMRRVQNKGVHGMDVRLPVKFSDDERDSFSSVLSKIFCYNPNERISADEVVRHLPEGWVHPQALEKLEICCRSSMERVLGSGSI